jgi:hypothetical protein
VGKGKDTHKPSIYLYDYLDRSPALTEGFYQDDYADADKFDSPTLTTEGSPRTIAINVDNEDNVEFDAPMPWSTVREMIRREMRDRLAWVARIEMGPDVFSRLKQRATFGMTGKSNTSLNTLYGVPFTVVPIDGWYKAYTNDGKVTTLREDA